MIIRKPIVTHIPIKTPPKDIILTSKIFLRGEKIPVYKMYSAKGEQLGIMAGKMTVTDGCDYPQTGLKTFHLMLIEAKKLQHHVCEKFIEFAKNISLQNGGEGRVSLETYRYTKGIAPEIPFRKLGFTTNNKEKLKLIDECIAKGTNSLPDSPTYMYFERTK